MRRRTAEHALSRVFRWDVDSSNAIQAYPLQITTTTYTAGVVAQGDQNKHGQYLRSSWPILPNRQRLIGITTEEREKLLRTYFKETRDYVRSIQAGAAPWLSVEKIFHILHHRLEDQGRKMAALNAHLGDFEKERASLQQLSARLMS